MYHIYEAETQNEEIDWHIYMLKIMKALVK